VRKQHFHALSVVTRPLECLRFAERTSKIASVLMDAARDLARWFFRTALQLKSTHITIKLACPVKQLIIIDHRTCGRQNFSRRTNINVALLVECEVLT
jgi:hypothetical protein